MTRRSVRSWITVCALGLFPNLAAADTYLMVPGTLGDATEPDHKGWIRVFTMDWTIIADSSWTKGGGVSVGKPNPAAIKLTLADGPWSTALLFAIGTGKSLDTTGPIIVEHVIDGRPIYRLTMQRFFLTKYEIQSDAQKLPLDTVEAVFKLISIDEFQVDAAGGVRGSTNMTWDIPAGTMGPASAPAPAPAQGTITIPSATLRRAN